MNPVTETMVFNSFTRPGMEEKKEIVNFLYENLENFGDPKEDIEKAIDYSIKEFASFGGFTLVSKIEHKIVGVVVLNQTGMKGYIPENILVYIATDKKYRGKGIGKELVQQTLELTNGDIALHVEPENPAKNLYEKLGFTNKYLEMRFKQKN